MELPLTQITCLKRVVLFDHLLLTKKNYKNAGSLIRNTLSSLSEESITDI